MYFLLLQIQHWIVRRLFVSLWNSCHTSVSLYRACLCWLLLEFLVPYHNCKCVFKGLKFNMNIQPWHSCDGKGKSAPSSIWFCLEWITVPSCSSRPPDPLPTGHSALLGRAGQGRAGTPQPASGRSFPLWDLPLFRRCFRCCASLRAMSQQWLSGQWPRDAVLFLSSPSSP